MTVIFNMRLVTFVFAVWTLIGNTRCTQLPSHVYQGCFYTTHHQQPHNGHLIYPFHADNCLKLCSGIGRLQAGLHNYINIIQSLICYCDDDLTKLSKADDSQCKPCKDDSNLLCGDSYGEDHTLSVYEIETNFVPENSTEEIHKEIEKMFEEEPMILFAVHEVIYLYNATNQSIRPVVKFDYPVHALDYHLHKKEGFAISGETIFRFPLFPESMLSEIDVEFLTDVRRCPAFAVDWVHDRLYIPDCYNHFIVTVDLNSHYYEDYTVISLRRQGAWAMGMAVDPYKGLLFWTTGATLWSCRLDGRELTQVVPEFPVNRVSSLSLDLAAERVYFTGADKHDKNSSRLYFASYGGHLSLHPLQYAEYEDGNRILSFGIYSHHIYFVKNIGINSSVLMASKLDYLHRPSVFIPGIDEVELIRLVHPRLQSPGKEDACTHRGCSHLCVVEASTPHCLCPAYYQLEHDEKTCFLNPVEAEEVHLLLKVELWAMPVLFVLLGAGVLMCLVDKLWSQLHPTVVRLSVEGSLNGRGFQDRQNLI